MQITETTNEGLKRAYRITIPASEIDDKIKAEVKRIAPQVRMPGFRPGKVPANLVRKMHGEQLHAQVVNDTIQSSVDELIKEKELRPAMQPAISLGEGYEEGKDAELDVTLEVLPKIDAPDTDGIKLERMTVPVEDSAIEETLQRIADQNKTYKDAPKTKKAADGDQVIIDFVGSIDGTEFAGGKAEDAPLVIGSGTFIPGFEDQLKGVKAGDEKVVKVTFPDDYQAEDLKGQDAEFAVTVKAVKTAEDSKIDDDFAKTLGLDSADKLRELVKAQMEQETAGLTRTQMKRQLLDTLAAGHDFPVPEKMVDAEFEQIWAQLSQEAAREEDPEAAMKEIEAERDDYRRIAERRVRLGLLLSEIGQANNVQITNQEMSMLMQQAAQQYRAEDRERFMQFIQNDPMAAAQLRAPLYEDKVVDFLFDKAEITDREVTREELEAAIEAEENTEAEAAKAKKAPAKKPAAKKAPAKKAAAKKDDAKADEKPAAKKPAAKKAPAKKAADKADDAKAEAKPAAKKAPGKKPAAKKAASDTAKEPAAKKAPAKKPAAKKAPAKKS